MGERDEGKAPVATNYSPDWHVLEASAVLDILRASRAGLAASEVRKRQTHYGANALPAAKARSAVVRFLLQFNNVLIYVLLTAALITASLGHLVDAAVILSVVVINAVIGSIQEGKAEQALSAIRRMLSLHAQVLRDGQRKDVLAESLVPGDIVFIASGDKVPADLRLLEVRSLRIEEAVLTGESVAVEKQAAPVKAGSELGDRLCMAFSGTLVTYGQGVGVVTSIGLASEIGRISAMLGQVQDLSTPLLRKIAQFGRLLTWTILAAATLMFAFGILVRGYPARDMFLAAVGLAVAAIPEGLPAIITITLAIGVQRMARRQAIVRRLPAVEALGSVTVICTDKTGTLTRNEMTVQKVITASGVLDVSGAGYAPHGGFSEEGREVDLALRPEIAGIGRVALLCNDASLRREDGHWQLAGDPTEGALLTLALKTGIDQELERELLPRTDTIPFESEHRFMASLHHDHAGQGLVLLKGAPERVLALCSAQRMSVWPQAIEEGREDGSKGEGNEGGMQCGASGGANRLSIGAWGRNRDAPLDAALWGQRMQVAAEAGMRLLAVAMRVEAVPHAALSFAHVESGGFTLLAVLGIADPPREEAIEAVAACRSAGIRVKMITGDHAITATAIAERLVLSDKVHTLTGAQLDLVDDAALRELVTTTDVFARASPEHKLRLVSALQANGEIVAMTGDGVNDAPALKSADVGVAMGRKGTEAAKEAAEIILADDNFASIVAAVEEGRTAYDNIRKAILFTLPTNGGEAGMVLIAILLGITLPITPVQILWVNMITEVTLSLAIAFERTEADIMRRLPRDPREPLLSRFLVWRIVLVSVLLVAGSLGLFLWELELGVSLESARTVAVNALVMGQITYLFSCRHLTASAFTKENLLGNRYVLLATIALVVFQMLFTYLPVMHTLFGTAAISLAAWLKIVAFGLLLLVVVEAEKLLRSRSLFLKGTGVGAGKPC